MGSPQLAMHSIREMMGVDDAIHGYKHLKVISASVWQWRVLWVPIAIVEEKYNRGEGAGQDFCCVAVVWYLHARILSSLSSVMAIAFCFFRSVGVFSGSD